MIINVAELNLRYRELLEASNDRFPVLNTHPGTGFFPLFSGSLGRASDDRTEKKVMIVGQEWGTADFAAQSLLQGQEDMTEGGLAVLRNWINLAGLDLQQCFFTNTYLFIRPINNVRGITPAVGIQYIDACRAAFCDVFKLIRPKIVMLCGNDALYLAQGFESEPSLSAYDGVENVFAHLKQPLRLSACGFRLRVFISPHWEYAQPNFENPLMPAVTPESVEAIWKRLGEELRADAAGSN